MPVTHPRPYHLPHMTHPNVLSIGMRPMTGHWLEVTEDPEATRQHKLNCRREHGDGVYAILPEAEAAAQELAVMVWQARDKPVEMLRAMPSPEWLWSASLETFEDLVVMLPTAETYLLAAASLCSPSHWRLIDKLGKPMARVHDPIPKIHEQLTPRIDRIMGNIRVQQPVERFNWSVQADSEWFTTPSDHPTVVSADTPLFYRVERQTLRRLPVSGALAFTIRVHVHPLDSLVNQPGALAALFAAIDATPSALATYKSFDSYACAFEKYRAMANR